MQNHCVLGFDKVDERIKIYDGIRYFGLSNSYNEVYYRTGSRMYNAILRINHLISEKSGITDSINHYFARLRIDSYNCLPIENKLTYQEFNTQSF